MHAKPRDAPTVDDSVGCSRRIPSASCCIFHPQNPFSRFSGATGARACKSNARCPLVNLRINTHRGDNLRSRASVVGSLALPLFQLYPRPASRFLFPFLFSLSCPRQCRFLGAASPLRGSTVPEGDGHLLVSDASLYKPVTLVTVTRTLIRR